MTPPRKVAAAAKKGVALAQGPLHAIRGTGEAEKLLKNAKTELFHEAEEIANYLAIEELANALYDKETAKLAKDFRRQEERMSAFLQKLIPQLAKQVVRRAVSRNDAGPVAALMSAPSSPNSRCARSTKLSLFFTAAGCADPARSSTSTRPSWL